MSKICYNCGVELNAENYTVEHVPAKNLYDDFDDSFKRNRITVPACRPCNELYSKIDQEIRDILAIKNDNVEEKKELTRKGVKSIMRRSSWKDRVYTDEQGNVTAVEFNYDDLKSLHIKNFKALFFRKYGFCLPDDFVIEIVADGDENMIKSAQILHDYTRTDKEWEVSGHEDVFKFILKDITPNEEKQIFYESGDFEKIIGVAGVLVYHEDVGAVVLAGKKEYVESCRPK